MKDIIISDGYASLMVVSLERQEEVLKCCKELFVDEILGGHVIVQSFEFSQSQLLY